jgi:teichuronic acid exporter
LDQETPSNSDSRDQKTVSAAEIGDYTTRAKKGFLWILSTTVIWQIISWLLTLITARILSPADYGLLAMNETIIPYLLLVATLRLNPWIVQRREFSEKNEQAILLLTLILGMGSTVIALFAAPLLSQFYGEPNVQLPFQVVSVVFILRAVQLIPESRLRRNLRFEPIAMANLTIGVTRGVLQLYLATRGFHYWSLVIGMIYGELAMSVWLGAVAGMPRRLRIDVELCREGIKYGLAASGSTIFWIIFSTADNLIVGKLFGTEVLGFYAMAFYLAELPLSKISSVLAPILVPYFSKIRTNRSLLMRTYLKIDRSVISIVAPVLIGLAAAAGEAVPLLLGAKWMPMVTMLQVMCIVGLWRATTTTSTPLLLAEGKPQKLLAWSVLNAAVLPACFLLLGRAFGLWGIYSTWLLVYPFSGILTLLLIINSTMSISPAAYFRNLKTPLLSTLFMAALVLLVKFSSGSTLGMQIILPVEVFTGAAAYAAAHWLFFREDLMASLASLRSLGG